MLSYFISQSNQYSIRTDDTASNQFTMSLQNMITQNNTTASLTSVVFTPYENLLAFTASISGAITAGQYRVKILNSGSSLPIYHGSLQVYSSESTDRSVYENKNTQYISNVSANTYTEYIIQ